MSTEAIAPAIPVEKVIEEMLGLAGSRLFTTESKAIFTRAVELLKPQANETEVYRHVDRGTYYTVQFKGTELQSRGGPIAEGATLTIYTDAEGKVWARPDAEFQERFTKIERF